jgi:hypothetical protein
VKTPEQPLYELYDQFIQRVKNKLSEDSPYGAFSAGYNAANQWISIADRLPELYQNVLVSYPCGLVIDSIELVQDNGSIEWKKILINTFGENPTHWMLLPAPPK